MIECPHCKQKSDEYYYQPPDIHRNRATFLNGDYDGREWYRCIYCKNNIHIGSKLEYPINKIKVRDSVILEERKIYVTMIKPIQEMVK